MGSRMARQAGQVDPQMARRRTRNRADSLRKEAVLRAVKVAAVIQAGRPRAVPWWPQEPMGLERALKAA